MSLLFLFLVWAVLWVMSTLSVDNLIRYEHDNYFDQWKRDGRPRGTFYHPEQGTFSGYYLIVFRMANRNPVWIQDDAVALRLYKKVLFWKKIVIIYFIMFLPLVIVAVEFL